METLLFVPENVLVNWYLHPHLVGSTEFEIEALTESFDQPVEDLQASIDLTMRFVITAQPLFGQGFQNKGVRPVLGVEGRTTLFWSIYEVREDNLIPTNETETGMRTETIIRYYGFDAGRRPMLETIRSHKREDAYINGYSWPTEDGIPPAHLEALLRKLFEFRRDLSK